MWKADFDQQANQAAKMKNESSPGTGAPFGAPPDDMNPFADNSDARFLEEAEAFQTDDEEDLLGGVLGSSGNKGGGEDAAAASSWEARTEKALKQIAAVGGLASFPPRGAAAGGDQLLKTIPASVAAAVAIVAEGGCRASRHNPLAIGSKNIAGIPVSMDEKKDQISWRWNEKTRDWVGTSRKL